MSVPVSLEAFAFYDCVMILGLQQVIGHRFTELIHVLPLHLNAFGIFAFVCEGAILDGVRLIILFVFIKF